MLEYEAQYLAQEATVDHLQLNYRAAAAKYAEAASLMASVDPHKQWEFMLAQAGELQSQGNEFGENLQSIAVHRSALVLAPREHVPLDWAESQNNLGMALRSRGEQEGGTARLEEAVAAFREALEEYTRERDPLKWAMTQRNLGTALERLGERESGTARVEAVAAFRAALEECTRERDPLDWAVMQNNHIVLPCAS
jgi:tetratricopeptide (TPR) repeat protein